MRVQWIAFVDFEFVGDLEFFTQPDNALTLGDL